MKLCINEDAMYECQKYQDCRCCIDCSDRKTCKSVCNNLVNDECETNDMVDISEVTE